MFSVGCFACNSQAQEGGRHSVLHRSCHDEQRCHLLLFAETLTLWAESLWAFAKFFFPCEGNAPCWWCAMESCIQLQLSYILPAQAGSGLISTVISRMRRQAISWLWGKRLGFTLGWVNQFKSNWWFTAGNQNVLRRQSQTCNLGNSHFVGFQRWGQGLLPLTCLLPLMCAAHLMSQAYDVHDTCDVMLPPPIFSPIQCLWTWKKC